MVAGFVASRFLKASSRERYQGQLTGASEPALAPTTAAGQYGA
jgi:hypothetical protein